MNYSLCFVTPAWRRYALSEITFAQRRLMCDELASIGIMADVVVIGDDENLDIARDFGFHIVQRDNEFLGRKFNDGHEFAMKSGYDFSVPVGSDMFVDSDLFARLDKQHFHASNYYAVVKSSGHALGTMYIGWGILQAIPLHMLQSPTILGRPCVDDIAKGCDTLTRNRIKNGNGRQLDIKVMKSHSYECVSFQSTTQITKFEKLMQLPDSSVAIGEPDLLLAPLKDHYPAAMVDRIVDYYKSGTSKLA